MSVELPQGLVVDVVPADDAGRVPRPGRVTARSPRTVVELFGPLPGWAAPDIAVVLTGDLDGGRHRWVAHVDATEHQGRLLHLRDLTAGTFVERRRERRLGAPYDVEWTALPGATIRTGVAHDLNHLGVSFTTDGARPSPGDRLVATVRTSLGPVTLFGTVVGIERVLVRVAIDHVHPESLQRLRAWETEQGRADVAGQVLALMRSDRAAERPDAVADDQPS
jgi:hypothetical protein